MFSLSLSLSFHRRWKGKQINRIQMVCNRDFTHTHKHRIQLELNLLCYLVDVIYVLIIEFCESLK